jgi:hypothetical protein
MDIFSAPNAVFRALFIPTEKVFQVDHDYGSKMKLLKTQEINKVAEE